MGGKIYLKTVEPVHHLMNFWSSNVGRLLLEKEQAVLDKILPSLFGTHLLQLNILPNLNLYRTSPVQYKVSVQTLPTVPGIELSKRTIWASPDALPVATESADVVILHHTLDISGQPHAVLREAVRTLIPAGHLIVIGFNQFSLSRLHSPWRNWQSENTSTDSNQSAAVVAAKRLTDWLTVLDCAVDKPRYCFYRPFINRTSIMKKLEVLDKVGERMAWPFGAAYIMVATKHVGGARIITPRWWFKDREMVGMPASRPPFRDLHRTTSKK